MDSKLVAIATEMESLQKQAASKHVAKDLTIPANKVDKDVAELQDRDKRKNNIILFNVPESVSVDAFAREQDDLSTANSIVQDQLHVTATLSNPVRFGPRQYDTNSKPRPLWITVSSEQEKWKVLKASKNLTKPQEESVLSVFMRRDMTPLEREIEANLRQQLKLKREQAEKDGDPRKWIIQRGKIISLM